MLSGTLSWQTASMTPDQSSLYSVSLIMNDIIFSHALIRVIDQRSLFEDSEVRGIILMLHSLRLCMIHISLISFTNDAI